MAHSFHATTVTGAPIELRHAHTRTHLRPQLTNDGVAFLGRPIRLQFSPQTELATELQSCCRMLTPSQAPCHPDGPQCCHCRPPAPPCAAQKTPVTHPALHPAPMHTVFCPDAHNTTTAAHPPFQMVQRALAPMHAQTHWRPHPTE